MPYALPGEYEDQIIDRFKVLLAYEPEIGYRMINVRTIMGHRGITHADVARYLGRSREFVAKALRPHNVVIADLGEAVGHNATTPEVQHRKLDEIEQGITGITDDAGGLLKMCGCTTLSIQVLREEMESLTEKEEQFNVGEVRSNWLRGRRY